MPRGCCSRPISEGYPQLPVVCADEVIGMISRFELIAALERCLSRIKPMPRSHHEAAPMEFYIARGSGAAG